MEKINSINKGGNTIVSALMDSLMDTIKIKWEYIFQGVLLSGDPAIVRIVIKHLNAMAIEASDYCRNKEELYRKR